MGGGSPRFRRDLQAAPVEAEGVQFVEVTDAHSGKSFRFYDFEHTVALALDGRPLEEVASDLRHNADLELTPDQLASFADQLEALGFLENGDNGRRDTGTEANGFFPPLTAHESGVFDRPALDAEAGDFTEDEKTPEPESMDASVPATTASLAPPVPASPFPLAQLTPPPSPVAQVALPLAAGTPPVPTAVPPPVAAASPPPLPTATVVPPPLPSAAPPVASAVPPPPPASGAAAAPRFLPLRPPPEPAPPLGAGELGGSMGFGSSSALGPSSSALGPSSSTPGGQLPSMVLPDRSGGGGYAANGAHAGEIEPLPAGPPPLPLRGPPPMPPPRTEPLRLVPRPPPDPTSPEAHAEELESHEALAELEAPEGEAAHPPLIFNTGATVFPPPEAPSVEDGPAQRLELSMTRRFITPERARPASSSRRALIAYGALGLVAAAIVALTVTQFMTTEEPPTVSVQVVVPSPTSVYRWWEPTATVQQAGGAPLSFASDGKVAEVVPAGTRFVAGDTLVVLESAKAFRAAIAHNKSRLAYYEQMHETATESENRQKLHDSELKIAEKKRLIAEAQEGLARHAVVATQPGEVSEALVTRGASVKAGEVAVKLKSSGVRALFELPKSDADKARQLGFCRVEIEGKPLECSLAADGGDDTHVVIELPNDQALVGKTVRLARDRLDAVFAVPASALLRVGESDRLYVVSPGNRAEMRVVAVADRGPAGATITQGLDVGDRVIVNAPTNLKPDTHVLISSTIR